MLSHHSVSASFKARIPIHIDVEATAVVKRSSKGMLYELIAIVRPGNLAEVREIAKTAGTIIVQQRGVIRGISNWGTFMLSKPFRPKGDKLYHTGHYFIMRFDSSAITQHTVRRTLGLDPRMIRFSVVKMGEKLKDIADVGGTAKWPRGDAAVNEA